MRVFRIFALALLGAALLIVTVGLNSDRDYVGSYKIVLNAPQARVWAMLSDVEGMPKRNPSIHSIEVLERKNGLLSGWREHLNFGQSATFALTDYTPMRRLQWTMLDSSYGMNGTWTFELTPLGQQTEVVLSESSYCHKFMSRAAMGLAGHDATIRRLLGDLEGSLK